ncbi:DMT family transporter [Bradyrhizobium sp. NBAIM20]|uniref:DMT family transporter n=1 Tax=unclassified Bradyrhizobium TaxID=2631580 RepID=UPI001CD3A95C|nr:MULTISPECIES: DMT family transporter [unclassified Bradyrhizobium]MCA1412046.1 DMT family transporter [Bradyrhizobium sp. NBAIM20]MCA1462030.1 DMT family transporter [Bradyrhizobium sp. NBAIM18]
MATTVESEARARPTLGIVLMAAAMLSIPLVDGIAKYLSADYSPLFIAWARYAVASAVVLPVAAIRYKGEIFPAERRASHMLRTVFLVTGMTLYFLSIATVPLATAVSAYFVGPVIAVALAAMVLKERLTQRKIASLALGFTGAIVILRPDGDIEPGTLLALGAGLLFALYLIATRQASLVSDPVKTLAFQSVVGMVLLTPQAILTWATPAWDAVMFFLALGALSAFSHVLSIAAFRFAEASTLSPLVYLELLGSTAIGYLVFKDIPQGSTIAGAVLIVTAGLILLKRPTGVDQSGRENADVAG